MCGISGGFAFGADAAPPDKRIIERLNERQRRRGPDGAGLWSTADARVVLGHRRLAIIDTTSSGAQPMADSSGCWVISFNGEIYNYRALRSELEHLGYIFRTNSDTEVLIYVVAEWGEAGLKKLRGMYAFALWDDLHQELWLVRDPYGIKPLYVAERGGIIWFASQARALADCAPINREREAAAVTGFYLWGHVPEPFTWWEGIRMLSPGHVLRIRLRQPLSSPVSFHRIEETYTRKPAEPLAPGELDRLFRESIQHHLVADVPVGVFLSAGIDSSVIAALAAESGASLKTITLGFREYIGTPEDEVPLAEETARLLNTDHTTTRITFDEFEELIDDFFAVMDQPTIDGLNTYLVSRVAAAQGLKVALSGLGGDELFGGYPSFRQIPKLVSIGRKFRVPHTIARALQTAVGSLPLIPIPPKTAGLLLYSQDIVHAYQLRRALYLEDELDALLDESWLREGLQRLCTIDALSEVLRPISGASAYAQVAALESTWYMRNQLLRDTDWSGMAHGLEVRVPFIDAHLLDRLGPAINSHAPPTKRSLAACAPRLNKELHQRPKTGFSTPVREWISRRGGSGRKLRGWADKVHQVFRVNPSVSDQALAFAAE